MGKARVRAGKGVRAAIHASLPLLSAACASLAALLCVTFRGGAEAARGDRVLSAFDPLAFGFREGAAGALAWLFQQRALLALLATLLLALTAAAACLKGGTRGVPAVLLSAAALAAVWGEFFLLRDLRAAGSVLFGAAVLTAAAAARARPLALTPGFPALAGEAGPEPSGSSCPPGWRESLALLALFLFALVTRAWALNQLPSAFDEEMISVHTQSRTALGLAEFTRTEFLGTSNGLATPLTDRLVFAAMGVSLYAARLTPLLWGLAAVPLFWGLVRRLCGGALPALGATLLFVCAPEQLFWSRSEVAVFAPVAALGLLFAHVGLSMARRFGIAPVLLAASLTPLCRFFYTAGHVLFAYPSLLAVHAGLFVKGLAGRALRSLPLLFLGIAVWVVSVSIAVAVAGGARRFVDPSQVRGEPAWRAGFPSAASFTEIAQGQAARAARNLLSVGASLTYHQPYATHWYPRFVTAPGRDPMVCVGLTILAAVGLGALLGQPGDRRAAVVLFWLGLGLLPGVLSDEPDARRLSLIFVPLLLLAALAVTAWVRLARDAGGHLAGGLALATAALALAGISACGLASHLLLRVGPNVRDEQIRFVRPFVERSGTIVHNLFYQFGETLEFGVLDRLLSPTGPCMQFVDVGDELQSLLRPSCDFSEKVYRLTLSPEEIESRRRTRRQDHVSYVFADTPSSRRAMSALRAIDAGARVAEGAGLVAFEVNPEALRLATAPEESPGGVRGGFLVPKPGWYRLVLDRHCPGARLAVGSPGWNGEVERPLLPGLFPFEISGLSGCASRARPMLAAAGARAPFAPVLTAPSLARLPGVRGTEPTAFAGWPEESSVLRSPDQILGFGVDRKGRIYALLLRDQSWEIRRYSPDGVETKRVRADLPLDASTGTLLVDPEGGCIAFALRAFERFDENLVRQARWELPDGLSGSHAARLSDGHLAVLAGSFLRILDANGRVESVWGPEGESRGKFELPIAVAIEEDRLAVLEEAGGVHVFRLTGNPIALRPESRFALTFAREPHSEYLRGAAFDGPRLLVPYSPEEAPLIVDLSGARLMPARASGDLRRPGLLAPYRFWRGPHELLVLDAAKAAIRRLKPGGAP